MTRSNRYRGPLNPSEIIQGMEKCLANISELMTDAEVLMDSSRFSGAFVKTVVAFEETGKYIALGYLASNKSKPKDIKNFWNIFYNHESKAGFSVLHYMETAPRTEKLHFEVKNEKGLPTNIGFSFVVIVCFMLLRGLESLNIIDKKENALYVRFDFKKRLWTFSGDEFKQEMVVADIHVMEEIITDIFKNYSKPQNLINYINSNDTPSFEEAIQHIEIDYLTR